MPLSADYIEGYNTALTDAATAFDTLLRAAVAQTQQGSELRLDAVKTLKAAIDAAVAALALS